MIVRPIAMAAVETRAEGTLHMVIQFIEQVHRFGAEHRYAWSDFIELDTFSADVLRRSVDAGLVATAQQGIYALERISIAHLRYNIPAESEIWLLHAREENSSIKPDVTKDLQWDHMSFGYLSQIAAVGADAARHEDVEIVRAVLFAFANMQSTLIDLPLGDRQKDWILRRLAFEVKEVAAIAASNRVEEALSPILSFGMVFLDHVFKPGKPYARAVSWQLAKHLSRSPKQVC